MVLQILDTIEPESLVIVTEAAEYRAHGVPIHSPTEEYSAALTEDWWVPQLHAFAMEAMRHVAGRRVFVILDAGKSSPRRQELRDLLQSVEHCGVLATMPVDDPESIIASRTPKWNQLLAKGGLGPVLKDIAELPAALDEEKPFLRIQMLNRAGLSARALEAIEHELEIKEHANPAAVVKIARIAEDAGASETATRLLDSAIESLVSHESLLLALATAQDTGNEQVEGRVAKRIAALFPQSPSLRRQRAAALASARRYSDAADALGGDPLFAEQASLFKALADFLETPDTPDYLTGIRALANRMPELAGRALGFCIQDSLDRGLLIHALTLATSDVVKEATKPIAKQLLRILEQIFINRDSAGNLAVDTDDFQPGTRRLLRIWRRILLMVKCGSAWQNCWRSK